MGDLYCHLFIVLESKYIYLFHNGQVFTLKSENVMKI